MNLADIVKLEPPVGYIGSVNVLFLLRATVYDKLFDEPKVCITDACVSSADSKIPKRKSSCELPLWK